MGYAFSEAVLAVLIGIAVFAGLMLMRDAVDAYEARGWGRLAWPRLHWVAALIVSLIVVGLALAIELGP